MQYTSPLNDLNWHRLFGDVNGDGTVDGSDLRVFGNAFRTNNSVFDSNADGTVNSTDLTQFGNRFGISI